ncbi:SelT/SelW/SelH family protein [Filobacillus milosensis]|uniref:SelT/SelW/SelH family protein n=1 Tax=Filobacillus milosensis TaxID=94137 RepID=A0A4Y8IR04_9BACI|nr:SelT/SelW/SelH family protein [Filobacillus milosensis]
MELTPSSGGAFEVIVNGEKIYSKLDTGVFPEIDEIIKQINSSQSMR